MSSELPDLPRTLSLMPTWQCPAECQSCGTGSSPREKTALTLDHMLRAIEQAAESSYEVVVFTGGEATLARANLLTAVRHVRRHEMKSRVVTNGYWAVTPRAARRRIGELVEAGLNEINFSTGDEHARFIPLERLLEGVHASIEADLPVTIMVETRTNRQITADELAAHPKFRAIRDEYPSVAIPMRESPWMPLDPYTVEDYAPGSAANAENIVYRKGCDSILTTTTVQADGRIASCCGLGIRDVPELTVGTVDDTTIAEADERASDDFLKHWIRVEGPERILAWAASHDASIGWENMYAHRCQACLRLYSDDRVRDVIRRYHTEKVADVIAAEYLLFHHPEAMEESA